MWRQRNSLTGSSRCPERRAAETNRPRCRKRLYRGRPARQHRCMFAERLRLNLIETTNQGSARNGMPTKTIVCPRAMGCTTPCSRCIFHLRPSCRIGSCKRQKHILKAANIHLGCSESILLGRIASRKLLTLGSAPLSRLSELGNSTSWMSISTGVGESRNIVAMRRELPGNQT